MMSEEELRQEMRQYIRYITGRKSSEHALQLFVRANEQPSFILNQEEENQLRKILPHPILIPLIDCATGLFLPNHFLRGFFIESSDIVWGYTALSFAYYIGHEIMDFYKFILILCNFVFHNLLIKDLS